MITQHLILTDPLVTRVWACKGCRATIGEGRVITHPDDCPEMAATARPAVAAYRKRIAELLRAVAEHRGDAEFEERLAAIRDSKPLHDALEAGPHTPPCRDAP